MVGIMSKHMQQMAAVMTDRAKQIRQLQAEHKPDSPGLITKLNLIQKLELLQYHANSSYANDQD